MPLETTQTRRSNDDALTCAGCGARAFQPGAKLCPVCGKLISEGFQPLDAIRSSYKMQRRDLGFRHTSEGTPMLFEERGELTSNTAWACTVYSMVPYLGILFVPLALAFGGFGYFRAQNGQRPLEMRLALRAVMVSIFLLAVQLLLWWLLYLIPEIGI